MVLVLQQKSGRSEWSWRRDSKARRDEDEVPLAPPLNAVLCKGPGCDFRDRRYMADTRFAYLAPSPSLAGGIQRLDTWAFRSCTQHLQHAPKDTCETFKVAAPLSHKRCKPRTCDILPTHRLRLMCTTTTLALILEAICECHRHRTFDTFLQRPLRSKSNTLRGVYSESGAKKVFLDCCQDLC